MQNPCFFFAPLIQLLTIDMYLYIFLLMLLLGISSWKVGGSFVVFLADTANSGTGVNLIGSLFLIKLNLVPLQEHFGSSSFWNPSSSGIR